MVASLLVEVVWTAKSHVQNCGGEIQMEVYKYKWLAKFFEIVILGPKEWHLTFDNCRYGPSENTPTRKTEHQQFGDCSLPRLLDTMCKDFILFFDIHCQKMWATWKYCKGISNKSQEVETNH